jgi:hypothetical protein
MKLIQTFAKISFEASLMQDFFFQTLNLSINIFAIFQIP